MRNFIYRRCPLLNLLLVSEHDKRISSVPLHSSYIVLASQISHMRFGRGGGRETTKPAQKDPTRIRRRSSMRRRVQPSAPAPVILKCTISETPRLILCVFSHTVYVAEGGRCVEHHPVRRCILECAPFFFLRLPTTSSIIAAAPPCIKQH